MKSEFKENMHHCADRFNSWDRKRWRREIKEKSRRGEYIGAIIFNLIFLWIVNSIPQWHLGFIKDSFMVVQWILVVNIMVQIAANALMLAADTFIIRRLSTIVSEASGFVTTLVLYFIYPFDFHNYHGLFWIDRVLPILMIVAMIFQAIKVISNAWKLLFRG